MFEVISQSPPSTLLPINPLEYPFWDSLIAAHPRASFFHRTAWARVLRESYGHVPFYLSEFSDGRLDALLPIMEVNSRWTGRRGVSLPFSDFCPALTRENANGEVYLKAMELGRHRRWKYLECRDRSADWPGALPSLSFWEHKIDLREGGEAVFKRLDGAIRRGLRKAQASGLKIDLGTSGELVETYYALHCQGRRRHGLPPQPLRFFRNIQRHVLGAKEGVVVIARLQGKPLAGAMFFFHGDQALYKFGASDYAAQNLRPNNLVMWSAIEHCLERGMTGLHLGRTSLANAGLRRFKTAFGAGEEKIDYCKYDFQCEAFVKDVDKVEGWFNRVFGCLPLPLLRLAGEMAYPHLS
jgi:hypothetical protein